MLRTRNCGRAVVPAKASAPLCRKKRRFMMEPSVSQFLVLSSQFTVHGSQLFSVVSCQLSGFSARLASVSSSLEFWTSQQQPGEQLVLALGWRCRPRRNLAGVLLLELLQDGGACRV